MSQGRPRRRQQGDQGSQRPRVAAGDTSAWRTGAVELMKPMPMPLEVDQESARGARVAGRGRTHEMMRAAIIMATG